MSGLETCDVLIVGAGPAGSTCAWRLQSSRLNVQLIDKAEFPRDKTCAGWVTPEVLESLRVDLDEYRCGRVLQPIRGFRTGVIRGPEIENRFDRIVSYGIRRCEFDDYLRQRSGVPCRLGEPVRTIARRNGTWVINDRITARMLVGAGGHFCPVSRFFGGRSNPQASVVTAQEVEFELSDEELGQISIEPEMPELFFCEDLSGYGWCFLKGRFLNIGLGRLDRRHLSEHVQSFCEFLRHRNKIRFPLKQRFHGHAYQLYERIRPLLVRDAVLLIGDSAGLAYPQSGEGIRPAIESAILAADVIRSCADADAFDASSLARYEEAVAERFGRPRNRAVSEWLPSGWLSAAARRLLSNRWFARNVVLDKWFLHSQQPALPTSEQPQPEAKLVDTAHGQN